MTIRKGTATTIPIEWLSAPLKQYLLKRSTTGNTVRAIPTESTTALQAALKAAVQTGQIEAVERIVRTQLAQRNDHADAAALTMRTQQIMTRIPVGRLRIDNEWLPGRLTLAEATILLGMRRDVQLGRRTRRKNRYAAQQRGKQTHTAAQEHDIEIIGLADDYRRDYPYDRPEHSTRALAHSIARKLRRPYNTIRNRLARLNLR